MKKEKMSVRGFRLDDPTWIRICSLARKLKWKPSDIVRASIFKFLDDQK